MNQQFSEPNPPSRKEEDFPKTTTIPDGWVMPELMNVYNAEEQNPVPATGGNGKTHDARPTPQVDDETLFTRRLDPFPKPNTIPTGWDLSGMNS